MTCIIAVRQDGQTLMGVDSISASWYYGRPSSTSKMSGKNGRMLIGGAGCWRLNNLVEQSLVLPNTPRTGKAMRRYMVEEFVPVLTHLLQSRGALQQVSGIWNMSGALLVATPCYICKVQTDLSVVEEGDYLAIGAGEDYALGSLHTTGRRNYKPRERVLLALKASADLCPMVKGPFKIKVLQN